MNKQNLWFISLFSLILILSIYYLSVPNSLLEYTPDKTPTTTTSVNVTESSELVALRVADDESVLKEMDDLQSILLDTNKTADEKNVAYESLKSLNSNQGKEKKLESLIKTQFNYNAFVKINNDQINIVINASDHNKELANNIMLAIQKEFTTPKYITVKFS